MRVNPKTAANAPGRAPNFAPTNTAKLIWLAPGRIRHMVEALRNSSSPIHCFSTTRISRDQAERPPPNEAKAIWLNVQINSHNDGFTAPLSVRVAESLMHEIRGVRGIRPVMGGRIQRIRCVVMMRMIPIVIEHVLEARHDFWVLDEGP